MFPDYADIGRQSAEMALRVLRGEDRGAASEAPARSRWPSTSAWPACWEWNSVRTLLAAEVYPLIRALRHSLGTRVLASNMALRPSRSTILSERFFLWTYSRDLERQLTGRAEALADFLAGQSQFAMLVGDRAELERIARNAVAGEEVVFVRTRRRARAAPAGPAEGGGGSERAARSKSAGR